MAIVVETDLEKGTFLQRGVVDPRLSRAVRACIAANDDSTDLAIGDGWTAINDALSAAHPDDTFLPKVAVRAAKWGAEVKGRGIYLLSPFGGEATDPFAVADIDIVMESMDWWSDSSEFDSLGAGYGKFPAGPVNVIHDPMLGGAKVIRPWSRTVPIMRIAIAVTTSNPPIGTTLWDLTGTLNENAFNISNRSFPKGTLLFVGPEQKARLFTDQTTKFSVVYRFAARRDGWIRERPTFLPPDFLTVDPDDRNFMFPLTQWDKDMFITD